MVVAGAEVVEGVVVVEAPSEAARRVAGVACGEAGVARRIEVAGAAGSRVEVARRQVTVAAVVVDSPDVVEVERRSVVDVVARPVSAALPVAAPMPIVAVEEGQREVVRVEIAAARHLEAVAASAHRAASPRLQDHPLEVARCGSCARVSGRPCSVPRSPLCFFVSSCAASGMNCAVSHRVPRASTSLLCCWRSLRRIV